jgi:hypothetical protein
VTAPTYSANQPLYGPVLIETAAAGRFSANMFDCQPLNPKIGTREGFKSWELEMDLLQNGIPSALIQASPCTFEDTFYLLQGTLA